MKRYSGLKRLVGTGAFLLTFLVVASLTLASEEKIGLTADKAGKGTSGEAVITDAGNGQKDISIAVTGLKPGGVYTVWFVTTKPKMDMAGVGASDYVINIDDKGNGTYRAKVSAAEPAKWQIIEIAYHEAGDPKDMKHMDGVLKGGFVAGGMGM